MTVPANNPLISAPAFKPKRTGLKIALGCLGALVLVACLGASVAGFFFYQSYSRFQKAHDAYLVGDCLTAIPLFTQVLGGADQVDDLESWLGQALREKGYCEAYQSGVDRQGAGEVGSAVNEFYNFQANYPESELAALARDQVGSLVDQSAPEQLAVGETCTLVDQLLIEGLIRQPDNSLPPLYLACGRLFNQAGDGPQAFGFFQTFLQAYPAHQLGVEVENELIALDEACAQAESLQADPAVSGRAEFMPRLYLKCMQTAAADNDEQAAYDAQRGFLTYYPGHANAAEVTGALLANPVACAAEPPAEDMLTNADTESQVSFLLNCGTSLEASGEVDKAIRMLEGFMTRFPDHPRLAEAKTILARLLIARAEASGAGEIAPPAVSGSSGGETTRVIIQNDSPETLRIVLSGPETRIEVLPPCTSCTNYELVGPATCPALGPVGEYSLLPGQYRVLVEASSGSDVTPFTGDWLLNLGEEYSSCFFIVTTP